MKPAWRTFVTSCSFHVCPSRENLCRKLIADLEWHLSRVDTYRLVKPKCGRFEDTLRSKKIKPVNRRRAAIHVLNRMQGLQMGTAQAGKWRLVLGKEEMTSRLQDLFWRNANMIAAVSGTIYKDPQPDTRTKLPSTNLAGDQGS